MMGSKGGSQEEFEIFRDPSVLSTPAESAVTFFEKSRSSGQSVDSEKGNVFLPHYDQALDSIEDINHEQELSRRPITPPHSNGPSGDEAVFDDGGQHTPSQASDEDMDDQMSQMPEEIPLMSSTHSPYTPMKQRSPFRNPSSVRAMQLDTTPPFNHSSVFSSPRSPRYKLHTPSRSGTPRSVRSQSTKPKVSPKKKEFPLVLLHVTLLPIIFPYPLEIMASVLPHHIIENYNLLRDKVNETMLERGVLLPHPKEDYELLEERLLESLELKLPRILKCGHFHLDEDDLAEIAAAEKEDGYASDADDTDICDDCGRRVRDGKAGGTGQGHRRWNIKIFAANGLMRAGAWSAAWREMERIDVEIEPWVEEDLRKEMKARMEDMEEKRARDKMNQHEVERRRVSEERLKEIYGEQASKEVPSPHEEVEQMSIPDPAIPRSKPRSTRKEIPISTVFQNYLRLLMQDPRNIAIVALGLILLLTAFGSVAKDSGELSANIPTITPLASISAHASEAIKSASTAIENVVIQPASAMSSAMASKISVAVDQPAANQGHEAGKDEV